jgi:single-strand DNA-binding protein
VADPELRFAPSSAEAVTNFRLAVNRPLSKEKKTDFFKVVIWGKKAEAVATYLRKGSQCAVEGSVQINRYSDRNANICYSTVIVANQVDFLCAASKLAEEEEVVLDR